MLQVRFKWVHLLAEVRASKFAQAQTVELAALAAQGSYIGRPDLMTLFKPLCNPVPGSDPALTKAKMMLLLQGGTAAAFS